jgi:phage terminase large subunit GpA-like protein
MINESPGPTLIVYDSEKTGKIKWVQVRRENHALDCEVYALSAIDEQLLGGLTLLRGPQGVRHAKPKQQKGNTETRNKSWLGNRKNWLRR